MTQKSNSTNDIKSKRHGNIRKGSSSKTEEIPESKTIRFVKVSRWQFAQAGNIHRKTKRKQNTNPGEKCRYCKDHTLIRIEKWISVCKT